MERVGKTMLQLFEELKGVSLKTLVMLAIQGISALEELHSCGFVHRDIKPDNIAIALAPDDPKIYLIDLGLSYECIRQGIHVSYSENENFQGTPYFSSLAAMRGIKPTRRDDLEALGYVLLFLLRGHLPWFSSQASSRDNFLQIRKIREKSGIKDLCQGLDPAFKDFLTYCQNLPFADKPDYQLLKTLFSDMATRLEIEIDWKYDWSPKENAERRKSRTKIDTQKIEPVPRKKEKRRLPSSRISPSKNMTCLCSGESVQGPGQKLVALHRKFSVNVQPLDDSSASSTAENTPDFDQTPVHRVEQLPSFDNLHLRSQAFLHESEVILEPKTAPELRFKEEEEKRPAGRRRLMTCDATCM